MARRTPTFECLSKPLLTAGAERTPAVLVGGMGIVFLVLAWFAWSLIALVAAILMFIIGMPGLQMLAKRDPQAVEIGFRYARYRRHYPARVTVRR
jgi:type IV secretory pathway TrbD component